MKRFTFLSDGYYAVSRDHCYEDQNEDYCGPAIDKLATYENMQSAARGHWIVKRFGGDARCSVCGCSSSDSYDADSHDRFCRHCGAEMDSLVLENKK